MHRMFGGNHYVILAKWARQTKLPRTYRYWLAELLSQDNSDFNIEEFVRKTRPAKEISYPLPDQRQRKRKR